MTLKATLFDDRLTFRWLINARDWNRHVRRLCELPSGDSGWVLPGRLAAAHVHTPDRKRCAQRGYTPAIALLLNDGTQFARVEALLLGVLQHYCPSDMPP
jgi:hypothetical protein